VQKIKQLLTDLTVPQNFVQSAPLYNPNNKDTFNAEILKSENPQSKQFMDLLVTLKTTGVELPERNIPKGNTPLAVGQPPQQPPASNPDEIQIDDL